MSILAVALDRFTTSFTDGVLERGDSLLLGCSCASHVEDFLLQNRAVQIINTVAERDLCQGQTQAHPIRGQVVHVVEVKSVYGEIAELFKCGRALYVGKDPMGLRRLEGERDKAGKACGLILQFPQLTQ